MTDAEEVIQVIRYNLDNFGCIDRCGCDSIDGFLGIYYKNIEDSLEIDDIIENKNG